MTEIDLLPLFFDVNQDIDTQFQFWLSITFAVLVASFVADDRLGRGERIVITLLYLSAAAIIFSRYTIALAHLQSILGMFDASGVARPAVARLAAPLRLALFTLGSLVAGLSVLFPRFGADREASASAEQAL